MNNNANKTPTLFDIRNSDIRRAQALHYKDPYTFIADLEPILPGLKLSRWKHLLFTVKPDGKFTLSLRDGSVPLNGEFVTYLQQGDSVMALYKDARVKGTLVYLNKSDSKEVEDGVMIYRKTGLVLIQGSKFFGYNMSSTVSKNGKLILSKDHIYGYGQVIK